MSANSFFMLKDMDVMSFLPLNHLFKYYLADNNLDSSSNRSSSRDEVSMNISSIQNLLDDVLVSRLTNTIGYLDNIVGQDYKFTITPSMQGDDDQDPLQIDDTEFYPERGRDRIRSMIETRPDWCVSRQRVWGVPLPIFINKKTSLYQLYQDETQLRIAFLLFQFKIPAP